MKKIILIFSLLTVVYNNCIGQSTKLTYGPVFEDKGATYDLKNADFIPDSSTILKAIFDIDYKPTDSTASNFLISSLHRYINMHVKNGVKESNISLAFVLHGASSKDALTNKAYQKKYGIKNPNYDLIKTLSGFGVHMYICGQSASYAGIPKSDILPEIKVALSAMSVLTVYQMDGYSLIKF